MSTENQPEDLYGFYPSALRGPATGEPFLNRASLEEMKRWDTEGVDESLLPDDHTARDVRSAERRAWLDDPNRSKQAGQLAVDRAFNF